MDTQRMNQECSICNYAFDGLLRPPYAICNSHHLLCPCCCYRLNTKNLLKCPQCRSAFKKPVKRSTSYELCDNALILLSNKYQKKIILYKQLFSRAIFSLVSTLLSQQMQIIQLFKETVIKMMRIQDYHSAGYIIRKIIEAYPKCEEVGNFVGIGMIYEYEGYYENKHYDWFETIFGPNISFYDLLAICYLKSEFSYQFKKTWFQAMNNKRPQSIQALFGLAVTELNQGNFEQSQILFDKIIEMNHEFCKPHLAKKIILFMVETPDTMIQSSLWDACKYSLIFQEKLSPKQISQYQQYFSVQKIFERPKFTREMGNIHHMLMMKEWNKANDDFIEAHFHLGVSYVFLDLYEEAFDLLINILRNKSPSPIQTSRCFQYIGKIYFKIRYFNSALQLFEMAYPNAGFSKSSILAYKVLALHYIKSALAFDSGKSALQTIRQWMDKATSIEIKKQFIKNMDPIYYILGLTYFQQRQFQKLKCLLQQWGLLFLTKKSVFYCKLLSQMDKNFESKDNQKDLLQWQMLNLDLSNNRDSLDISSQAEPLYQPSFIYINCYIKIRLLNTHATLYNLFPQISHSSIHYSCSRVYLAHWYCF